MAFGSACGAESLLRAYNEGVFSAGDEGTDWIDDPVLETGRLRGRRVGPYRLEEEIGLGGMSVVYRAERADGAFGQTVAVKLSRRRLHADGAEQRFRAERQVLASLDHPNIAGLVDGGVTDGGWSCLVMEHVEGVPLTEYARPYDLRLVARLDLLDHVVEAVLETTPSPASTRMGDGGCPPEALRGDLEVILEKALRKEPDRRYASAEAFGADLRRHRRGEPVEAQPATFGYRAHKFVQRKFVQRRSRAVGGDAGGPRCADQERPLSHVAPLRRAQSGPARSRESGTGVLVSGRPLPGSRSVLGHRRYHHGA